MTSLVFTAVLLVLALSVDTGLAFRWSDPCEYHRCKNGGRCDFPLDYPICICPSGFGGNLCEYAVPVKNGTCPEIPNDEATCHRQCEGDFNCPGTQKCCSTFCERMCIEAVKSRRLKSRLHSGQRLQ